MNGQDNRPQERPNAGSIATGTLSAGEVLQVGGFTIGYQDGRVSLVYRGGQATVEIAAYDNDRAAFAVHSDGQIQAHKRRVDVAPEPPLVSLGQGDYTRSWPDDQAAGLREMVGRGLPPQSAIRNPQSAIEKIRNPQSAIGTPQ